MTDPKQASAATSVAVRILLVAVLVDVVVGAGVIALRFGLGVLTSLVGPNPGPQAVAAAEITRAALLVPALRRRPWAMMSLAVAYLLSPPVFLPMAGLLHLDWLLSNVLHLQGTVAPLLAAGLFLLSRSAAGRADDLPSRARRGAAAFGFVLALVAQIALLIPGTIDAVDFSLALSAWSLVLPVTIVALPIILVARWLRRRRVRLDGRSGSEETDP